MTSSTLNTGLAMLAPSSPSGSPRSSLDSPRSPRSPSDSPSSRSVTQEESGMIRFMFSQWKTGQAHIDNLKDALYPEACNKRAYAREVYVLLKEEVRCEPNRLVLRASREALYAAEIFANLCGNKRDFKAMDKAYIRDENALLERMPELRGGSNKE